MELRDGLGAGVAFEAVGVPQTLQAAIGLQQLLQFRGDCAIVTSAAREEAATARLAGSVESSS